MPYFAEKFYEVWHMNIITIIITKLLMWHP